MALAGVLALAARASAGDLEIACEPVPGGGRSLLVESGAGADMTARQLDDGNILIVVDDADPTGWEGGAQACRSLARISVVRGALLGAGQTRIVVHAADAPRLVSSPSRVRLLWLPARPAAPVATRPEAAPSAPAPPRRSRPETRTAARQDHGGDGAAGAASTAESVAEPVAPAPAPARPAVLPARADLRVSPDPSPAPRAAEVPLAAIETIDPPSRLQANIATEARSGPGRRHDVVRRLAASELVTVDARMGDWARLTGGSWVFAPYFAAPSGASEEFLATVSSDRVQVRSGPGDQHDLVAEIFRGESVAIDDVSGGWAHVRNGGWVPRASLSR